MNYLIVALGGMLGAVSRYFICTVFAEKSAHFPYATLTVNLVGCFLMGAITEFFCFKTNSSLEVKLFLTTGFLGAFTTFSTFESDAVSLIEKTAFWQAFVYVALSVVLGMISLYLAMILVRMIFE